MSQFVFANNVSTQLAAAATALATSLTLASSTNLPTLAAGQVMPLTLKDAATGSIYETVYVTAISGVTLTVLRAQEGTGAQSWSLGDYAFCAPTAGTTADVNGNPANTFLVAAATAPGQAAQLSQVAGVVGQVRNLSATLAVAGSTLTFSLFQDLIVETAAGVRYAITPATALSINIATSGVNGMGNGTVPPNPGFVGTYVMYNPITGAIATTGIGIGTGASTPLAEVCLPAFLAAGYTASALISVWPVVPGTTNFGVATQVERGIRFASITVASTSSPPTALTSVSLSAAIPVNAKKVCGLTNAPIIAAGGSQISALLSGSSAFTEDGNTINTNWIAGGGLTYYFRGLLLAASRVMYWAQTFSSSASNGSILTITGYDF